jgi:leucyl/phenylalanyl-tRNA--protein transferase
VIRKETYQVRVDEDFEGVIRACADRETWISAEIIDAYVRLHHAGKTHSVEAYKDGELAAVSTGSLLAGFHGESMFTRMRDASKVCFVYLVERLKERGYELLDCQIHNPHLARLGRVRSRTGVPAASAARPEPGPHLYIEVLFRLGACRVVS